MYKILLNNLMCKTISTSTKSINIRSWIIILKQKLWGSRTIIWDGGSKSIPMVHTFRYMVGLLLWEKKNLAKHRSTPEGEGWHLESFESRRACIFICSCFKYSLGIPTSLGISTSLEPPCVVCFQVIPFLEKD